MATIQVKVNTDQARKQIKGIRDQVPFATRLTLNQLARTSKKKTEDEINRKIDRPTRFTLRSIQATKATSRTMTATVKVKDKVRPDGRSEAKILGHLFGDFAGSRQIKAFENLMRSRGILPNGKFIVPGEKMPLDSFGNMRRSALRKVINGLRGTRINRDQVSTLAPGIWLRKIGRGKKGTQQYFVVHRQIDKLSSGERGKKLRPPEPWILFVDRPRYRRLFNMKTIAQRVIVSDLDKEFEKNYEFALKTAKKV